MSVGWAVAIFHSRPAGRECFSGCAVHRCWTAADVEADSFYGANSLTSQYVESRFYLPPRDAAVNLHG